jgi:hypothetical protein
MLCWEKEVSIKPLQNTEVPCGGKEVIDYEKG